MKTLRGPSRRATLIACALLVAVRLVDRDGCLFTVATPDGVQLGAIFGAVVSAIGWIGGWLGSAAAASAAYLASAVQWLALRLSTFIKATGAVFAKSWDALKITYEDVLKPAVQWVDAHIKRLYDWLQRTFRPVFDFLSRVRAELLDAYRRFVQPFLNVIDAVRGGLRVLGDLGVAWARELDQRLGSFESLITQNFQRLLGELNKVIDVMASVFTLDRLIQRFTFLRTLQRDTRYVWRVMVNAGARPITVYEQAKIARAFASQSLDEMNAEIRGYWNGESNDTGAVIDALASAFSEDWTSTV